MKNETDALNEAILLLHKKRAIELELFKEQFHSIYESYKPINLLKNTLHKASASPKVKSNILDNAIGIGTGFLTKKLLLGSSRNPIKRLFGTFLQFAVAKIISNHSDGIKSTGKNLIHLFSKPRKEKEVNFQQSSND